MWVWHCGKYSFNQNMNGAQWRNRGGLARSLAAVTRALEKWRHFPKPGNSRWVASEREAGVREQLLMYAGRAGPVCRGALFSFMHPPARLSSTTARCFSHRSGPVARVVLPATPNTEPGKCPVISHHVGSLLVRRNDGWSFFFFFALVNCLKVIRGKPNRSRSAVTTRSISYSRVLCAVSRAFWCFFVLNEWQLYPWLRMDSRITCIVWGAVCKYAQVSAWWSSREQICWQQFTLFVL